MSGEMKIANNNTQLPCLWNLQREVHECLNTFPKKVTELNKHIETQIPESVKLASIRINDDTNYASSQLTNYRYTSKASQEDWPTVVPEYSGVSSFSMSTCDRNRRSKPHGINKRKLLRSRNINGTTLRRRPGPLGQILTFVVAQIAFCTKKVVLIPSSLLIESIYSILFQRPQLESTSYEVQSEWKTCLPDYTVTFKQDNTAIGNLINVLRPATIQLIADTTILKRWLQALTLSMTLPLSMELINATRNTETIDCWGYEFYFHLKFLQANRANENTMKTDEKRVGDNGDEITLINLWHRLVQLRDNYIILYEMLTRAQKVSPTKLTE